MLFEHRRMQFVKSFRIESALKLGNLFVVSFNGLSNYVRLFRVLLPENKVIHSLVFLTSAFITLNLFIFNYNQLAIIFYCTIWFLNAQHSTTDQSELIDVIMNDREKKRIYQEEIIKIVQSRYLLVNDSLNNYQWLNYLIKIKWTRVIRKV